ncbi:amidohydrolase family protein [Rheinheimera gaetbuli]
MKLLRIMSFALSVSLLGCGSLHTNYDVSAGLLVEKATIISADSDGRVAPYVGYVLIDKDIIVYSGKHEPRVSGSVRKINAQGKYIIPGLIDSHVHLANVAGMSWQNKRDNPQLVKSYFSQLPKSFLYFGYTTLIDVNNYAPAIVTKIKNMPVGPDIYTLGKQLQVMNDFMMEMEELPLDERLEYPFIFDKYNKNVHIPDSVNLSLHSPKAIISQIVNQQEAIGAKIVYEDESSGFPPFWALPSLEIMKDIILETKRAGIPLVMHATSYDAQKFGVEAGIQILAHPMWNWYRDPKQFLDLEFNNAHRDLLTKIATNKIGSQLTFRTIYGEVDLFAESFLSNPSLKDVYPEDYLAWLGTEEANWGKKKILNRANIVKAINPKLYNHIRPKFETDEAMFSGIQSVLVARMKTVANFLADNDAMLLFGTDGVAMNMVTNPPGFNGYLEMQHWSDAGISAEKIFLAATYNNAKAFNLDNRYGTIAQGKVANLVLLDSDPLQDISAYDRINTVIVRGESHARTTLSAMAHSIEK